MKKTITILFIFASILLLSITANAQNGEYLQPYLYEDFEDLTIDGVENAIAEAEIINNGFGNSKGALKVTQKGDMKSVLFPIELKKDLSYEIQYYVFMTDSLKPDIKNGSFVMFFKDIKNGSQCYKQIPYTIEEYTKNKWVRVTASFVFDAKAKLPGAGTVDCGNSGTIELRIGNGKMSDLTDGVPLVYYIDDVCLKPLNYLPSETEDTSDVPPEEETEFISNGNFENDTESWSGTNLEFSLSDDVPEECNIKNSLFVDETKANAWLISPVSLKKDKEYVLSFFAKGVGGNSPINTVKIVPTMSFNDDIEVIDDDSLMLSENWKKYEVVFRAVNSYNKFQIRTSVDNRYRNKTKYLINAISLKNKITLPDNVEYETPEIRNVRAEGEFLVGETINITYEYLGKNTKTGFVQLFKDDGYNNWASVMRCEMNDNISYTFSPEDIGHKFKLFVLPMDTTGQTGGYKILELSKVSDLLDIESRFINNEGNNISAEIKVKNRSDDKNIVGILVLLDNSNAQVDMKYISIEAFSGLDETYNLSVDNTYEASKVCLYIWEGKSDIDTTMVRLSKSITSFIK